MDKAIVVDTKDGIDFFRLCSLKGNLKLELANIRVTTNSAYPTLKKVYGFKGNKQEVLQQAEDKINLILKERNKC